MAALPEAERAAMAGEVLPSFAQVWAVGFMYAVENWPDEWQPPRDADAVMALVHEALAGARAHGEAARTQRSPVGEEQVAQMVEAFERAGSSGRVEAAGPVAARQGTGNPGVL